MVKTVASRGHHLSSYSYRSRRRVDQVTGGVWRAGNIPVQPHYQRYTLRQGSSAMTYQVIAVLQCDGFASPMTISDWVTVCPKAALNKVTQPAAQP